ncbi:MAG: PKD domain-containing protein [Candidatus Aminicenantes bacterium]|nr:PKD domain-containing protein [Candidatus Aminicenantes bacterium]
MDEKWCRYMYRIKFLVLGFLLIVCAGLLNHCKQVPFTVPDNATLHVSVNPPEILVGGTAEVKVLGFKASGAPLPDGTVIFFTCDIGSIDATAETTGGTAIAVFRSDDKRSGTANVEVSSGNADGSVTIGITTPILNTLIITAQPQVLPPGGGTAEILVIAYDEDMNPLPGIPVVLTGAAGYLESRGRPLYTDAAGEVQDILETTADAAVTAESGEITASVKITVASDSPPEALFVYSPKEPIVGENVYFNASGSSDEDGYIVNYEWDFGDGRSGSGEKVKHRYPAPATYRVVLVVYDDRGNKDVKSDVEITVSAVEGN